MDVAQQVRCTVTEIPLSQLGTEGETVRVMRTTAQEREAIRSTGAKREAQQASASGLKPDIFSILRDSQKHTTSLCAHHSACLKHCNFLKQH